MYTIKICGELNQLIKINNLPTKIIEKNNEYFLIQIQDEESFFITTYPITESQKTSISYIAKIIIKNNILSSDNPNIIITKYENNYYKIYIKKMIIFNKNITKKYLYNYKNNDIKINILDTYPQQVLFTNKVHSTSIFLDYTIKNPIITQYLEYYALEGDTNINQKYLLLLNNNGEKIIEITADKIEKNNNNINTLHLMKDISSHGYVSIYSISKKDIKLEKSYSVYMNDCPKNPANNYAIPWAFVEALNIGNIKLARSYLCNEINEIIDDQHLTNYFGNYCEMEFDWINNNHYLIWVIYPGTPQIAKNYTFELKNKKIYNIINND